MSEHEMKMFAEIFGEQKKEETVIAVNSEKTKEIPISECGGTTTLTSREEEQKKEEPSKPQDTKAESVTSSEDGEEPEPFPKKDLGAGGASFADEILRRATPEILAKLKSGEKTMNGCWNWVYSFVRNEYIRQNGRNSGGMWMDVGNLITRYFDEIPEGTVCEEEKPKRVAPPPSPAPAVETAKKIVKKVAKRAAKAAKKAASKAEPKKEMEIVSPCEEPEVPVPNKSISKEEFDDIFATIDFSVNGK